jgi:hypothetical protein
MAINKILASSGLAVAGIVSVGAVHFASAQTPTPVQSTPTAQVQTQPSAGTTSGSESTSEAGSAQENAASANSKETTSATDTDTVNNQQGPQGVDNQSDGETKDGA